MSWSFKRFWAGLTIVPKSVSTSNEKGDLEVLDSDSKLRFHNGSTNSPVVTETHLATLENKTISADNNIIKDLEVGNLKTGVLNTDLGTGIPTDSEIPSALATKALADSVQANLTAHINETTDAHDASAISVSPIVGVTGSEVQSVLSDLKSQIDSAAGDAEWGGITGTLADQTDLQSALDSKATNSTVSTLTGRVDDLETLSGVPANSTDLGSFTGTTIPDNSTIKGALQSLETATESVITSTMNLDQDLQDHINDTTGAHAASAISNVPSGNLEATTVQGAVDELQGDIDTTNSNLSIHTSSVSGVHGVTGLVVGTTNTQTLTNKTLTSPTINGGSVTNASVVTPSRSDVKQDTFANLVTYASTATNGQLVFATDDKKMYQIIDGVLSDISGGGGGGDTVLTMPLTNNSANVNIPGAVLGADKNLMKMEYVATRQIVNGGTTWTNRTSAADNSWTSVTYGNGLFVAVSSTGTGDRVMTSPDGITWTIRTNATDNYWRSVTYGNGLFVAVADFGSGTGNRVMTSPDGITWTIRTSGTNAWNSVTYGNGLFVAVAADGVGNRVMTSPDGITWTNRTSANNVIWTSVTYGNGLFVAVSSSGIGNRVMTSLDGITWTGGTSGTNAWRSVTYGNGLFVAVALNGTGNRVMTSPITTTFYTTSGESIIQRKGATFVYTQVRATGDTTQVSVNNSGDQMRVTTSNITPQTGENSEIRYKISEM